MEYKKFVTLDTEEQIIFSNISPCVEYSRWFLWNFTLGSRFIITNKRIMINLGISILIKPFYSSFYFEKTDAAQQSILKISYTRYAVTIYTRTGDIIKVWGSTQTIKEFRQSVGVGKY